MRRGRPAPGRATDGAGGGARRPCRACSSWFPIAAGFRDSRDTRRCRLAANGGSRATPRRAAAASIAAGTVRSFPSTTAASASSPSRSCSRTSGGRWRTGRGTSRSAIPTFSTARGTRASWCTALAREFPGLTYDVTIKIEHLAAHADAAAGAARHRLPVRHLRGGIDRRSRAGAARERAHPRATSKQVVARCRAVGLTLVPTFVAFTPWTTLAGYCELLAALESLDLIEHVPPVQLMIRLLIPDGSRLLELDDVRAVIGRYSPASLTYPWPHRDPAVDALQRSVEAHRRQAAGRGSPDGVRPDLGRGVRRRAADAAAAPGDAAALARGDPVPERALVLLSGAHVGAVGSDLNVPRDFVPRTSLRRRSRGPVRHAAQRATCSTCDVRSRRTCTARGTARRTSH